LLSNKRATDEILRLRRKISQGMQSNKKATGVAFFIDFHIPPSDKPESVCVNQ
jgi:hypothetical protein